MFGEQILDFRIGEMQTPMVTYRGEKGEKKKKTKRTTNLYYYSNIYFSYFPAAKILIK